MVVPVKAMIRCRFEGAFAALAPQLKVIAPWREWEFNSRQSLLNYLAEKKVPTTATATKIYSRDANLFHISHEGGELENPWNEPSEQVWMWTKSPEQAPDKAEYLQLSFEKGELTAINGNAVGAIEAIEQLNAIGSEHGVGRIDIVENRLVGMKSRGCYETPGGTIIVRSTAGAGIFGLRSHFVKVPRRSRVGSGATGVRRPLVHAAERRVICSV